MENEIEILECGFIIINHGKLGIEKTNTHKLIIKVKDRVFKRLNDHISPIVWSEGFEFLDKEKSNELESIIKAHFMQLYNCEIEKYKTKTLK